MKKAETNRMHNKIEGRGRKLVARFVTIFGVLAVSLLVVAVLKNRTPEQVVQQSVSIMSETVISDIVAPTEEPATQDVSPKMVIRVSGDPSMGQQQFSPPTNSVVVVNEEHLRQLQEQARKAHQPQQTVQQ